MQAVPTSLPEVLVFVPVPHHDDRGFFTRTFDAAVARAAGLDPAAFVQDSQSRSHRGVVRGLHVRRGGGEAKLVRCASGAVFDVVVDVRPGSATFGRWQSFRLDDIDHHVLYVPRGYAHGWQSLSEPADVCYRIDVEHDPREELAIACDDPELAIPWPLAATGRSPRDANAPALSEVLALLGG